MGNDASVAHHPSQERYGEGSARSRSGSPPGSPLGSQRSADSRSRALAASNAASRSIIQGEDMLPPMVLILESVVWSSTKDPSHSQMFCMALLDGCEVGRAVSYPSPSVRVAPCTMASTVTLRFFAGLDADAFLMRTGTPSDPRQIAEVRMPLVTIVQYGAPLYTSMWLGLPGDEAQSSTATVMELKEALDYARRPVCPKVRVTFFKPAREGVMYVTPRSGRVQASTPRGPQPDIQAVFAETKDDSGWDACLGPSTPVHCEVPKVQQVRGLVEALKHANEIAYIWQRAVYCPPDEIDRARRKRDEEQRTKEDSSRRQREARKEANGSLALPTVSEDGASSVVSILSTGRQDLLDQLAAAQKELDRLRGVEDKQQALQRELEKAHVSITNFGSQERQHIEDLQKKLVTTQSENASLRSLHNTWNDQCEEQKELTGKVELLMQENLRLKKEQFENHSQQRLRVANGPQGSVPTEEHERLKMQCVLLKDEKDALRQEREDIRRERDLALEREAAMAEKCDGEQTNLRGRFEALYLQIDAHRSEKEGILDRNHQLQAKCQQLVSDNETLTQREVTARQMYRDLEEQLAHVDGNCKNILASAAAQEKRASEEKRDLQEKLAQAQEKLESLASRFEKFQAEPILTPQLDQSGVVPIAEYERVQMKFKEADQEREGYRARLELQTQRLRDLEEMKSIPSTPSTPTGSSRVLPHERSLSRVPPGMPLEEAQALRDELVMTQTKLQAVEKEYEEVVQAAKSNEGVSMKDYHAALTEIEELKEVTKGLIATNVSVEEYQALQLKLNQVEQERQGWMGLASKTDRWEADKQESELEEARQQLFSMTHMRDDLDAQLSTAFTEISSLRSVSEAQQKELEIARLEMEKSVLDRLERDSNIKELTSEAVARAESEGKVREQALQSELRTVLRALDEVKKEKQEVETQLLTSSRDLRKQESSGFFGSSGSLPPTARGSQPFSRHASEEIVMQAGEKTALGAKVSELRLAMKKKEAAHKEDISKLNKELMTCRVLSNQDRARRTEMENTIQALEEQARAHQERAQVEADRAEQLSQGDQELHNELARLKGEVEVLRIRERQWQAIATTGAEGDSASGSLEAPVAGGSSAKSDSYVLRLFHRLLWEKFSHYDPDDFHKALKMDQRPATLPKSEVEKAIKGYRAFQKNFTMAKAFRSLDVHHTGRLASHEFEMRLTQSLSLDVELSGHIYNILHTTLHGGDINGGDNNFASTVPPSTGSAIDGTESARSLGSKRGLSSSTRMDSARSIEAGMISEEEFAKFFESRARRVV